MKTGKIKLINFTRKYNGNFGVMYVYYVEMDNNDWGELQVKVENKYKIGDEINYELEAREYQGSQVWQIKVKTSTAPFGGGKGESIEKQLQIARMAAIKSSVDLILGQQVSIKDLLPTAEKITNYIINGYGKNNGNL